MSLCLAPGEPEAGPWRAERLASVAATAMLPGRGRGVAGPLALAVDGRSSSGKATLAARLQDVAEGPAVVHTDDIAWRHSRFGWVGLPGGGIPTHARAGRSVSCRPPRWDERQRPGAIEVPADCPLLVTEGAGAARRETARLAGAAIWVQADEREAERRNLARAGQPGGPPAVRHLRDRMAGEMPFPASRRPWESAGLIVCGTPQIPFARATQLVVAPPLAPASPAGSGRPG